MSTLSCPIPADLNLLQSNGFQFSIAKYPEVSYFCQEANIPDISLPSAEVMTPLSSMPFPGDKLVFGDLTIQFLIDENMNNYKVIHDWMVSLGFPKLHNQYSSFVNKNINSLNTAPSVAAFSDATLIVLNSVNMPVRTVHYIDITPTGLQTITLRSTETDTNYLAGVATFNYNYYEFM